MRRLVMLAAMGSLALAGGLCGDEKPRPAEEKEEEFVTLFNGKNIDNWIVKGKSEGWQVKEGIIRSEGAKGGDWLRSKYEYGDFILKLEWKVSKGGNSGVFIRIPDKDAPWQNGYEVQISNENRDDLHCTGALYGYAAVKPRPDESPDKWHSYEIRCVGPRIKVVVNGVAVVDVDQTKLTAPAEKGYTDPKTKPLKGYIGLQDAHAPAGHYIEFRNIRIKELQASQ